MSAPRQELLWRMASVGIGERLRNARQALGLSFDEIESVTRIRRPYLEALEQEAFDDLPSPAYVRGFLRTYAAYLGIPTQELLDQYPSTGAGMISHRESPVEVRITPATRMSPTRRLIVGAGVVLGLGALGLGIVLYSQVREFAQTGPAVPKAQPVQRPGPSPPSAAAPPGSGAASTPSPSAPPPGGTPGPKGPGPSSPGGPTPSVSPPPAGSPSPGSSTPAGPAPGKPSGPPASPSPGATPSPGTTPTPPPAAPLHVVVVASGYSWVRTVADGTTVYEGFLNAGDKQVWEAKRSLTVKVGNASAVDLSVNGRSVGRLGGPGDVYEHTFSAGATTP